MDHELFIDRNIIVPGKVPSAMKAILKSTTAGYCGTCAASNRRTKPLTSSKLLEIFNLLLPERESISELTRVCWECEALLLKCLRFRRRAEQAQRILTQSISSCTVLLTKSPTGRCLSTLTTKIITSNIEPVRGEVRPFGDAYEYANEPSRQTDLNTNDKTWDVSLNDVIIKNEDIDVTTEVTIDPFDQCATLNIKYEPYEMETDYRAPVPTVTGIPIPVTVTSRPDRNTQSVKQKFVQLVSNDETKKMSISNLKGLKLFEPNSKNELKFNSLTHGLNNPTRDVSSFKNVFGILPNLTRANQSDLNRTVDESKFIQLQNLTSQPRHATEPPGSIPVTLIRMRAPKNRTSTMLTSKSLANQTGMMLTNNSLANRTGTMLTNKSLANQTGMMLTSKLPFNQTGMMLTSKSPVNQTGMMLTNKSLVNQTSMMLTSKSPVNQTGMMLTNKSPVNQTGMMLTRKSPVNQTGMMLTSKSPVNQTGTILRTMPVKEAGIFVDPFSKSESKNALLSKLLMLKKLEIQKKSLQQASVISEEVIVSSNEDMATEAEASIAVPKKDNEVNAVLEPCTPAQRADNGAVYKCAECGYTGDRHNTYMHVKMKHKNLIMSNHKNLMSDKSDSSLRCNVCDEKFTCKSSMYLHRSRVHVLKGANFQCDACSKTFPDKNCLKRHKRRIHSAEPRELLECPKCNRKYRGQESLSTHMSQHNSTQPVRCGKCNIVFPSKRLYRQHVKISVKHAGETQHRFECDTCGKTFYYKYFMKQHIQRDHMNNRGEKQICGQCGKALSSKRSLMFHIMHVHEKVEKQRTEVCEICGKAFWTKELLKGHRRIHSSLRPFKCGVCGDTFKARASLYTHNKLKHLKLKGKPQKRKKKSNTVARPADTAHV